jgi:tetratricopeptide (TPR) repeat protein
LVLGIFYTTKRHVLGFVIISFLVLQIVPSNLIFPTGTMFLESYLFHASMVFCIALAWLITEGMKKLSERQTGATRMAMLTLVILLIVPSAMKSWERSKDWKNDITLFLKDVINAPNSVLVLGNAGARWIDLADTKEITGINIPGQDSTRFNDYNGTLHITDEEVRQGGFADKREAALNKGIDFLKHAVELHPRYVNGFLNLGLAYFKLGKEKDAIIYWKLAERLYPNNPYLNNYYQVYGSMLNNRGVQAFENGDYKTALIEFNKWTLIRPKDPDAWANRSDAAKKLHLYKMAQLDLMKVYELAPERKSLNMPLDSTLIKKDKNNKGKNGKSC